jgi:hypothetical protein
LIKVDIEGIEMEMLRGAWRTINEQRPVFAILISHNIEMLELPKMIKDFGVMISASFLHHRDGGPSSSLQFPLSLGMLPESRKTQTIQNHCLIREIH